MAKTRRERNAEREAWKGITDAWSGPWLVMGEVIPGPCAAGEAVTLWMRARGLTAVDYPITVFPHRVEEAAPE